jgi:hypothetical protein
MGRVKSDLTPTQRDDKQFAEMCDTIRAIGPRKLAEFADVSHETIINYKNRQPIQQVTEDKILTGIRKYKDERDRLAVERRQMVGELLAA